MESLANLPFLLFCLGAALGAGGHRINIPVDASSWLGTLLVVLLGLKGGIGLGRMVDPTIVIPALLAGIVCALAIPLLARPVILRLPHWNARDSALAAGHYGSVSVATFLAMLNYLNAQGVTSNDHMIAVMAIMEAPALIVALVLAQRIRGQRLGFASIKPAIVNPPLLLLLGAMLVGYLIHQNPASEADTQAVLQWIPGLLSIYLLLLGQKAGGLLRRGGVLPMDVAFAAIWPLLAGALGLAVGWAFGLNPGNLALLAVLVGSASYIVAPAVLSQVMPDVDLDRTQVMVIGITFPVNLLLAIPLWAYVVRVI
ncbi:sodium-dependent bicarbonate transport family permease [bacterium]|nr:sodium-dependent bicarbonate transport family permease [bacterium]